METKITITKKSNTAYGLVWEIATTVDKMQNRSAIWADMFGGNDPWAVVALLEEQIESEGFATSENYMARLAGNNRGQSKIQKVRATRFPTTKLIGFGDRAGLNFSNIVQN